MADWLADGGYLPRWFRDFHEQKNVFKWIGRAVERAKERQQRERPGSHHELAGLNWIASHVYVIDYFLWFMAQHGWTLQRARPRDGVTYLDWDETIRQMRDEESAALRAMLDRRDATPAASPASDEGGRDG